MRLATVQFTLGNYYESGPGVPQDFVEAHKWRNLAAPRVTGNTQKEYADTPALVSPSSFLLRSAHAAFTKIRGRTGGGAGGGDGGGVRWRRLFLSDSAHHSGDADDLGVECDV